MRKMQFWRNFWGLKNGKKKQILFTPGKFTPKSRHPPRYFPEISEIPSQKKLANIAIFGRDPRAVAILALYFWGYFVRLIERSTTSHKASVLRRDFLLWNAHFDTGFLFKFTPLDFALKKAF